MKTIKKLKEEADIMSLCGYLKAVAANSKARIEALRALVESDFIDEKFYVRLIHGEKNLLLLEIQGYIDLFKGIQ